MYNVGRGGAMPRMNVSTGQLPAGPVYRPDYSMGPQYQQPGQFGAYMPQQGPQTGLIGREQALRGGFEGAMGALDAGMGQLGTGNYSGRTATPDYRHINANRDMALNQVQQGVQGAMPVVNQGIAANNAQAALSGAMGRDAQTQAFADFQNSPGYQYQLQEMEKALTRNAAATGGLGGGNVLQALQRNAMGLASQDFQNYYNRLGNVADRGNQALGYQTSLYGQGASAASAAGGQGAGVQGSAIGANASMNNAALAARSNNEALRAGLAQDAARYAMSTGQNMAQGRTNAGSALAQLYNQQGAGMADIYGTGMGNMANILATGGEQQAGAYDARAGLLSNVGIQGANIVGGMPGIPGIQQNPGLGRNIGQSRQAQHDATNSGMDAMGKIFGMVGGFGG